MNTAESERLGSYLEQLGYQATATAEEADFIVLNSCVVRQSAENRVKSRYNPCPDWLPGKLQERPASGKFPLCRLLF